MTNSPSLDLPTRMPIKVVPIVEGYAEVHAVPVLLRRIAKALQVYDIQIGKPIRCHRHRLVKSGELERAIELAVMKSGTQGRVLLLLDADEDCPAKLGPELLARAKQARGDVGIDVVFAKREFEAWFLGSLESLRLKYSIAEGSLPPADPEEIRGAKEYLSRLMGGPYSEVIDQPSMADTFDMETARQRCPSFDKFWRTVTSLLVPPLRG